MSVRYLEKTELRVPPAPRLPKTYVEPCPETNLESDVAPYPEPPMLPLPQRFATFVEERFGIRIDDADLRAGGVERIRDLVALLDRR